MHQAIQSRLRASVIIGHRPRRNGQSAEFDNEKKKEERGGGGEEGAPFLVATAPHCRFGPDGVVPSTTMNYLSLYATLTGQT